MSKKVGGLFVMYRGNGYGPFLGKGQAYTKVLERQTQWASRFEPDAVNKLQYGRYQPTYFRGVAEVDESGQVKRWIRRFRLMD